MTILLLDIPPNISNMYDVSNLGLQNGPSMKSRHAIFLIKDHSWTQQLNAIRNKQNLYIYKYLCIIDCHTQILS